MCDTMQWLNAAASWAEGADVPLMAFRDEMGEWWVEMELRDSRGWFLAHASAAQSPRAEVKLSVFEDIVAAEMGRIVASARAGRIRRFTKRNPQTGGYAHGV